MTHRPIYCAGSSKAILYAETFLRDAGWNVTSEPDWSTGHILLDIPSFRPGWKLRRGGNLDTLLEALPRDAVIWGGNLDQLAPEGFQTVDLLQDPYYLAQNAAITADCALRLAGPLLPGIWDQTPALIIGWGRIGKCLGKLLRGMDCPVTIAARKAEHRAALQSLGYRAVDTARLKNHLSSFRIIFNTVPELVISEEDAALCGNCIKIDLASRKGIAGEDVVWARGLPGIHAPESSGKLIAQTMLRIIQEEWK